jgi:uroporphyrinogen-III synthase
MPEGSTHGPSRSPPRRVAIVKSAGRADAFGDAVRALGLVPVLVSPFRVDRIVAGEASLRDAVAALTDGGAAGGVGRAGGWLAVTSPHAVAAFESLRRTPMLPRIAAVGAGTASALHAAGFAPTIVGDAGGGALAERMIAGGLRRGDVVLHPCGEDVRRELGEVLAVAGADVRPIPVYRMVEDEIGTRAAVGEFAAVIVGSPRLAQRAAELFPSRPRVVAIGRTTAAALRDLGWRPVAVAAQPTPEDAAAAVRAALS